jgi:hypothetical protein
MPNFIDIVEQDASRPVIKRHQRPLICEAADAAITRLGPP